MNYGLYLAAGGTMTNMHRLDVASNNLANLRTAGFKPDVVVSEARLPARLEDPTLAAPPQDLLEQLGGGHWLAPTRLDLSQGPLEETGNPLDVAIHGDGFFVIAGDEQSGHMLTRDGRFTLNERSELVMSSTGRPVLDVRGLPIILNPEARTTTIDSGGLISQDDAIVAQLRIASAPTHTLNKHGDNLFTVRDDARLTDAGERARLEQFHVEASAVNPILVLNRMIDASRAIEQNSQMMRFMDNALGQTINTFGRVA